MKLFVGNLPFNATEGELYNIFGRYGEIAEIHCLGASGSRSGQACAFVKYLSEEAGKMAAAELDGMVALRPHENANLLLQVRPARPQVGNENSYTSYYGGGSFCADQVNPWNRVKLFIGNLPREVTADDLNKFVSSYGVEICPKNTIILNCRVSANNTLGAFVFVQSYDDANRAITLLNGKRPFGMCGPLLKARLAHDKQIQGHGPFERAMVPRMYPADPFLAHPSAYGTGQSYILPTPPNANWMTEPSFKTYHQYMLMPQSPNYGPMNVVPGMEPWTANGVYSLPRASFTQQNIGQ